MDNKDSHASGTSNVRIVYYDSAWIHWLFNQIALYWSSWSVTGQAKMIIASTPHLRSGVRLPSGPPLHLTSVPVFGSLPVRLYTSPPFRCSAPFRSASTPHLRSGVRLPSGPPLHLTSVPVFGSLPVRLYTSPPFRCSAPFRSASTPH